MQGTICIPDEHLQSSTPPPANKNTVPHQNMDVPQELRLNAKEINQSNQNDSGILSATGNSTYNDMDDLNRSENDDTDNRSSCSSPDRKYVCPICETILISQHDFTLHIRSHNNETEVQDSDKGFICRICCKVLSSNASLDRHMLIHSGERPFTCKYCGDTFTTNGNMHRHMRTHTNKPNYESDGSSDSGASTSSKIVEFNNNKVIKTSNNSFDSTENKRKYNSFDENENKRIKLHDFSNNQTLTCPVCKRNDFNSNATLEIHLEDNHPDYPVKCSCCDQIFKNIKVLNEHKSANHSNDSKALKNSVIGFKDLTFVDFSSQKFPYIARYECEKNLHKAGSGPKFQCEKCIRAFPCAMALEIHKAECIVGLDLTKKPISSNEKNLKISEQEVCRNDFFARLDLQNNLQKKPDVEKIKNEKASKYNHSLIQSGDSKDLADIQSIISITTNGSLLQQLHSKSEMNLINKPNLLDNEQDSSKHEHEEESQDLFAAEFRKMKLRGEFPCRLCTAVFPNLRALKGHNRAHLNGNNNGMYRCNMCPHSSLDKAALIRHMRSHNGDRPYECSLCNYAFTTKANCERHLRNRHAKSTREEVKKSIIYHPSEDPSNEEISKMLSRDDTTKISTNLPPTKILNDVTLSDKIKLNNSSLSCPVPLETTPDASFCRNYSPTEFQLKDTLLKPVINQTMPFSPNFYPKIENTSTPQKTVPKINVINLEALQSFDKDTPASLVTSDCESEEIEDEPMDLVLDLSKKKPEPVRKTSTKLTHVESPQDLSKKRLDAITPSNPGEILAQQLMKTSSKLDPAGLYASQLALYRNGFPPLHSLHTWPFTLNPLLFQTITSPLLNHDPQEVKERLQRLQLCGGGMVMDSFADRLKNFHQQSMANPNLHAFNNFKLNEVQSDKNLHNSNFMHRSVKPDDIKPLSLSVDQNVSENIIKMQSPVHIPKSDQITSPNSVKMVIKNGVLMPKQKQRRYRTERPFSCEYCSARFTLRSNMERHIKQQHPQFWTQRHKSNVGNSGRKSQSVSGNAKQGFCNINIPSYDNHAKQTFDDSKDNHINDKIKYVILAQQLKESQNYKPNRSDSKIKEEEEDYPLIIDENEEMKKEELRVKMSGDKKFNNKYNSFHENQNSTINHNVQTVKNEETQDLVPVARLLDNASQQPFKEYFNREREGRSGGVSEEEEEGLVASCSTSEENNSGTDENRSESENVSTQTPVKKKSAYSLAPNRVSCPYCQRKFPWTSSLRRHVLTHTGQKPFKCSHCPLLFTTKSNCDRHLLRKHGNSASVLNNNDNSNTTNNYMMRNVPERPFKCSSCPSSTFSTYSNLKKHISFKHSSQGAQSDDARSQISTGYEGGSSEDEKLPQGCEQKSDWEKQITSSNKGIGYSNSENASNAHLQNSDLPFKCHLCDNSFGERHDALDHIKDKHCSEYDLLMSKNAFDSNATTPDDNPHHDDNDENEVRGKFPDYANRKVICAFCMRRFWSAEDLRRHMRTHTGERPFSCDVCHRRFTLKHSMLRHRKKHNLQSENDQINSDEDVNGGNLTSYKFTKVSNNNLINKPNEKTDESDGQESDLISNLLGIRDRSIIDQVLTVSADDAAKLLGVKNGE